MKSMLARLEKADPETWDYIDVTLKLGFPMPGICDPNGVIAGDIIQGSIQRACMARGWLLEQSTFTARPSAKIWKKTDPVWKTYGAIGESPAQALLAAYLSAIEGQA